MSQVKRRKALQFRLPAGIDDLFFSNRVLQRRLWINRLMNVVCFVISGAAWIPLFSIIYLIVDKGSPLLSFRLLTELPPGSGTDRRRDWECLPGNGAHVAMAMAMASPIGILAAIYICEYAPRSLLAKSVRFTSKLLTGIPSIICGVFAFGVVVLTMGHFSALAGAVALAVLALPVIILTTEQAFLAVPRSYREAAHALGATRSQTILTIVFSRSGGSPRHWTHAGRGAGGGGNGPRC